MDLGRILEGAEISDYIGEIEFNTFVEGVHHRDEVTAEPFDPHQALEDHLMEHRPQSNLLRIEVVIDSERLYVRNHDVRAVLIHRRDPGVELTKGPVRKEADHRPCLHPEDGGAHWFEHRAHRPHGLASELAESRGELARKWFDQSAEGLLIVGGPRRPVGGIQVARRWCREPRHRFDPKLGGVGQLAVLLCQIGIDGLALPGEALGELSRQFPVHRAR